MATQIYGSCTLGDYFLERKRQVDAAMEAFHSEQNLSLLNMKIDAGVWVSLALANMQAAYSTSLLHNRVSLAVSFQIKIIEEIMSDLREQQYARLTSIPQRVYKLLDILPGKTKLTQVRVCPLAKMSDQFCLINLKCKGFFPYTERYQPTLKLSSAAIDYATHLTRTSFQFAYEVKCEPHRPWCSPIVLTIPTETGYVRSVPLEVHYPVWVKIPPMVIGELTAHFISEIQTPVKRESETPIYTMKGDPDHPSQWVEAQYNIRPDRDWRMSDIQVRVHEGTMGRYSILCTRFRGDGVRLKVGLSAEPTNTLGLLHFSVKYTQKQSKDPEEKTVEKLKTAFEWGDRISFQPQRLKKRAVKIVLNANDGERYTFFPGVASELSGFFTPGQSANPFLSMTLDESKMLMIETCHQ